ncbi:mitochondrial ribosomal protein L7/L12 [Planoprotostelium fungivorum]|uniref:Mitochondrial ribosomal protein L7/L12 n=1 Tax=Planoprotostelium fungivorum TaxID=1890364 RepID=A0A2P6NIK9_9EUKA|nr:mitochondrial ribosomal protein L7/L12 [Planoprotostelium fungivorum]
MQRLVVQRSFIKVARCGNAIQKSQRVNSVPSRAFQTTPLRRQLDSIVRGPGDPYPPHIERLATEVASLSLIECNLFLEAVGKKVGAPVIPVGGGGYAPGPAAGGVPAAAAAPAEEKKEEKKEEKSGFTVKLVKIAEGAKYKVLKEIRTIKPNLSLPDSKPYVDNLPSVLGEGVTKEDVAKWKEKLAAAGGEISVE